MGMMKNTGGGEIVQVQGGHIVRNTGRKDRHSKVFTAKGPRDRRVRLSAHTAIQFYDVQDRLGYDRPSKAVDWLIKKAKSAIDKLAELPPWHPTTLATTTTTPNNNTTQEQEDDDEDEAPEIGIPDHETESSGGYNFHFNHQTNPENHSHSFMSSQIDSDAIAFFPTTYPSSAIISSRNTNNPSEDLGLSLHSFQDSSGLIHSQSSQVAADANPGGFLSWNNVLGSSFAQRGTLQSSFSSGWNDIAMNTNNNSNNNSSSASHNNNNNNKSSSQASIFGSRFVSDAMGIHGFCIPARIQGEEEEDDHHHGIASHHHHHRPASSASNSHH